jgi:ABC-type antimicrobial peptide transport system permease subunit
MMLIRLRPEVDAEAFMEKIVSEELKAGSAMLVQVNKYTASSRLNTKEFSIINSVLGVFIGLLLLNVMLGTLGTYWLQIRKRTEDIGIMRSFGAKRRHIFGMLWKEAALLTLIGSIIGQGVWLQFALNAGLENGFTLSGTGKETDWVNTFWLHYLVICVIQYLLLLAIVTLGMMVPAFIAMYKRPVEALRHE